MMDRLHPEFWRQGCDGSRFLLDCGFPVKIYARTPDGQEEISETDMRMLACFVHFDMIVMAACWKLDGWVEAVRK